MSLKVVTRNVDSKGFENVYIQYSHNSISKRFRVGPKGLKVKQSGMEDGKLVKCAGAAWKAHNDSIKDGNEAIEAASSQLAFIVRRFTEDNKEAPTPEVLEELWEASKESKSPAGSKVTFWQLFAAYDVEMKLKRKGNTSRALKPLGTVLKEFERARGIKLTLASFDFALMTALNDYMISLGSRNSTTRTRMAKLKAMLNHWVKMGISKHVAFREYKRDVNHKDAPTSQRIVALNETELGQLLALELDCPHLHYARALFTLSCGTGLRFSDAIRVGPHCIDGENIRITTEKTNDTLTIPLNWLSRQAFRDYPHGMRGTDLGLYNARLVKLGEMCPALHKPFERVTFSGITKVSNTDKKLKYQHLSSHVGRKTFVTLCLTKGVPEFKIRKWTGHKNLDSFTLYIDNEIGEIEMMAKFDS